MHLSIVSPSGSLFNGRVNSVMLPGALGSFHVLANHAPALSSLVAGKITYKVGPASSSISVKGGCVSIADNVVRVVCEPVRV